MLSNHTALIAEIAAFANLPVDAVESVLRYDWNSTAEELEEYLATEQVADIASWVRDMIAIDEELAA